WIRHIEDVTERRQAEALAKGQSRILEMIAQGAPLRDTLRTLTRMVEEQSEGSLCSILLVDDRGEVLRSGASPSLPAGYVQALDGLVIGPKAAACGTAAYR